MIMMYYRIPQKWGKDNANILATVSVPEGDFPQKWETELPL